MKYKNRVYQLEMERCKRLEYIPWYHGGFLNFSAVHLGNKQMWRMLVEDFFFFRASFGTDVRKGF